MLDFIGKKWAKNKDKLRERLANTPQIGYDSYLKLLSIALDEIVNDEKVEDWRGRKPLQTKDIVEINFGDYQGTQILVFHKNTYQPDASETYYTVVEYGSCSGCDTLLAISEYEEGLPSEGQINDYMTLCLHMLQRIHQFDDGGDE